MCSGCSLEEARKKFPEASGLYELTGAQGQLVLRVDWVSDTVRWTHITFGNRLSFRTNEQTFQQLIAPERRFQPVEINGVLRKERTLDIGGVKTLE